MSINVTLWFEDTDITEAQAAIYPQRMHTTIATFLEAAGDIRCRIFTMGGPQPTDADLDATDVLIWYGHLHHRQVDDRLVDYCWKRVLSGMGLIVPHSAHYAKLFIRLMGTTCQLDYRVAGGHERETLWVVDPAHPIVQGIGAGFTIPKEEVYREFHDIPAPDELVLISAFAGGEAFRSGCCWQRGAGRVFYFRPGHESCPTYHIPEVQRVLINAVRWAAPTATMEFSSGPRRPGEVNPTPSADGTTIIGGNHPLRAVLDAKRYR